jgi:hypothetical protein
MLRENTAMTNDTTYLRQESLRTVLVCTVVGLYAWCAVLFHTDDQFGPAWLGPALLIAGLAVALSNRNRNAPLAAAAVIVSFAAADLHSMWLAGMQIAPYMLAVVVSLTGLLFNIKTVTWATILGSGSIVAVGFLCWGAGVSGAGCKRRWHLVLPGSPQPVPGTLLVSRTCDGSPA